MKLLVLGFVSAAVMAGCNYQVKKTSGTASGGAPASKPEVLVYFADIQPILDRSCTKCHEEFASYDDLMASGAVKGGDAQNSELYNRLAGVPGGNMPKRAPPLPDAEAALIRDWINAGALLAANQTPPPDAKPSEPAPAPQPPEPAPADPPPTPTPMPTPTPTPVPVLATYTELQAQVFSQKCTMCHGDKSQAAGFSLEHYDSLVANPRLILAGKSAESGLYVSVAGADAYMPPKRAVSSGRVQPLTEDEKEALRIWIDSGAPNN